MSDSTSGKMWFRLLQHRGFRAAISCSLALGLVVSGALGACPTQAGPMSLLAAGASIAVVPSSVTVYAGDVFTLEIWVYPHGQQVDAVDVDMTFDPAYLEVLSITGDPLSLAIELSGDFDNTSGTLRHHRGADFFDTPPSTDFRLCLVEFEARAVTDGTLLAFTELTSAYSGGQPVETETTDTTVIEEPLPVGGVGYLLDPGQVVAMWKMELVAIAGLILGAVVILRRGHRGARSD
jgi:hypothetical protein